MVAMQMTPEAEAEHEWWVYWFSFVGSSLLGVLSLFGIFISVAVAPGFANALLPACGFLSFVVTMAVCCRIHSRHKRYQAGVFIPVISELGILGISYCMTAVLPLFHPNRDLFWLFFWAERSGHLL